MTGGNPSSQLEALMAQLSKQFYDELPERFDRLEQFVLTLQKHPHDEDTFLELYRQVHSLKGTAGTYDAMIITRICHHMENLLNECQQNLAFLGAESTINHLLQYLDWLHLAYEKILRGEKSFSDIESKLHALDSALHQTKLVALLVEPSSTLKQISIATLEAFPLDLTVADDGYQALGLVLHRQFDLVICGMELPTLNGEAFALAVGSQLAADHKPQIILLTSDSKVVDVPGVDRVLPRSQRLIHELGELIDTCLKNKTS